MIGNEDTTIPNTTGMSEAQLEAAVQRFTGARIAPQSIRSQVDFWASRLVPADCVVLTAEDMAALRRVLHWVRELPQTIDPDGQPGRDLDRLAALIGDDERE